MSNYGKYKGVKIRFSFWNPFSMNRFLAITLWLLIVPTSQAHQCTMLRNRTIFNYIYRTQFATTASIIIQYGNFHYQWKRDISSYWDRDLSMYLSQVSSVMCVMSNCLVQGGRIVSCECFYLNKPTLKDKFHCQV